MSLFTIPEIITYEGDDYSITDISLGVATASNGVTTVTVPAGDLTTSSTKVVYNSYTSLIFADEYHGRRLNNTVWRTADEDTRTSALFWATDILNRQSWVGQPFAYAQALSWPRQWVPNRNYALKGGVDPLTLTDISSTLTEFPQYLSDTTIPPFLMDATAELALYLIKRSETSTDEVAQYTDQLSSLTLGSVSLNFRGDSEVSASDMPQNVYQLIRDFLSEVKELDSNMKLASMATLRRS